MLDRSDQYSHLNIIGASARDRRPFLDRPGSIFASCNKGLRGPYTGVDTVLTAVLPEANQRWPELVGHHRMELLAAIPELAELIGPAPRTLAMDAPFVERTLWQGKAMPRNLSQGIVTFLREYAQRLRQTGSKPPELAFDDVHRAEPTTQEFIALFLRRVDSGLWPLSVGTDGTSPLEPALTAVLADYTEWQYAPVRREEALRSVEELASEYIASDGTSDDPAAYAAYMALGAGDRTARHDRRAEALEAAASWGIRVAALVYHRERGNDPHGKGLAAVETAAEYLSVMGFRSAAADMCERGRALADPDQDAVAYRKFTAILIAQTMSLGRLHEAAGLCREMRRRYTHPAIHMTASHFLAMIATRCATPRDHDEVLEYQNTALVIANGLPDERDRMIHSGFQDDGLALIEMHRGNAARALELVEGAIARGDGHFGPDEWLLHRSQLSYSRARLLAALGDTAEAHAAFTKLSEMDPYNPDYLSERAALSRQRGDLEAAVEDYNRAAELGPPFVELYHDRGAALAGLGRYAEALADFDYVLDMEPDKSDTLLSRAELLLETGRLEDAAADAERAMGQFTVDARLYCVRGMIHLAADDPAQAVVCFDAALELDPDYPAALVNRAVALFELSDPGRSVADLTRALELSEPDPELLLNRGIGYVACDDPASALADFNRALMLPEADIPELLYHRGLCFLGMGDRDRGQADLLASRRSGSRIEEIDSLLTGV
ncbi:MAG: tetratricopeptide repeat protein [Catenulispora sp.]|nr:tetratricopeptide repeat protein [Catenulispora sp.]